MKLQSLLVLIVATLVSRCSGYSTGAPIEACVTMTPMHGVAAQTSDPPYMITVSSATYTPGANLMVTVAGNTTQMFKGVLVQARLANCSGTTSDVPQGTFVLNATEAELKLVNCSVPGSTVTHNSSATKTTKSFTWTAPATDVGFVSIRVTIVQNKTRFWTNLNSENIKGPSNNCRPTTNLTTTTLSPEVTTPSGSEAITTCLLLVAFCLVLSFLTR